MDEKLNLKKLITTILKKSHILYMHAFTDAQLVYGYDGFEMYMNG